MLTAEDVLTLTGAMITTVEWASFAVTGNLEDAEMYWRLRSTRQSRNRRIERNPYRHENIPDGDYLDDASVVSHSSLRTILYSFSYSNPVNIEIGVKELVELIGSLIRRCVHWDATARAERAELRKTEAEALLAAAVADLDRERLLREAAYIASARAQPAITFRRAREIEVSAPELAPLITGGRSRELLPVREAVVAILVQDARSAEVVAAAEQLTDDVQLIASIATVATSDVNIHVNDQGWTAPR